MERRAKGGPECPAVREGRGFSSGGADCGSPISTPADRDFKQHVVHCRTLFVHLHNNMDSMEKSRKLSLERGLLGETAAGE